MKSPFFMVVDATGSIGGVIPKEKAPTKMHTSFNDAKSEASRLAMCNPGRRFVVLQSVGEAVLKPAMVSYTPHQSQPCEPEF